MTTPPSHIDYHGVHVATPHEQAIQVNWTGSMKRTPSCRIREHTCGCEFPMFEFCSAAGLAFIRKNPSENSQETLESDWLAFAAARALWEQILTGRAR